MVLYKSLVSGELLISSLGLCSSLLSFSVSFVYPVVLFFLFGISLWCCLLLASSMAESSHCFLICSGNSVRRLVFSLAFTLLRANEVNWESVIVKALSLCYC
jgi:hypothetical protein